MNKNIPTISTIGLVIFLVFYIISALCYINIQKYHYFFVPLLIGFAVVIFDYLYKISKLVTIKKKLLASSDKVGKIETCPEYWKKIVEKDSIKCSNKDVIPGNISIAPLQQVGEGKNKYNMLNYNDISLTDLNVQPNEEKCSKMFQTYNKYTDAEMTTNSTLDNKNSVSWVEYHNKCLLNL